jgi:hypothetical protein
MMYKYVYVCMKDVLNQVACSHQGARQLVAIIFRLGPLSNRFQSALTSNSKNNSNSGKATAAKANDETGTKQMRRSSSSMTAATAAAMQRGDSHVNVALGFGRVGGNGSNNGISYDDADDMERLRRYDNDGHRLRIPPSYRPLIPLCYSLIRSHRYTNYPNILDTSCPIPPSGLLAIPKHTVAVPLPSPTTIHMVDISHESKETKACRSIQSTNNEPVKSSSTTTLPATTTHLNTAIQHMIYDSLSPPLSLSLSLSSSLQCLPGINSNGVPLCRHQVVSNCHIPNIHTHKTNNIFTDHTTCDITTTLSVPPSLLSPSSRSGTIDHTSASSSSSMIGISQSSLHEPLSTVAVTPSPHTGPHRVATPSLPTDKKVPSLAIEGNRASEVLEAPKLIGGSHQREQCLQQKLDMNNNDKKYEPRQQQQQHQHERGVAVGDELDRLLK